jgi:HD-like signal output (HDOD) protein
MSNISNLDNLIARVKDFPTLPTIYTNLLKAMANPNTTVREVAEIITSDQSTTIKILKFANSSVFSFKTRIDNISDAIFHIGFKEIKNIVLAISVMKLFKDLNTSIHFNIVDFWKHSIGTGVIARFLAEKKNIQDIENYFISGILHDIGKLFMLRTFNEKYIKTIEYARDNNFDLNFLEKKVFGFDHAFVGSLLIEKWKLSTPIYRAVKHHHSLKNTTENDIDIAAVHLANIMTYILEFGNGGDNIADQPYHGIWEIFNFEKDFFVNSHSYIYNNYLQAIGILSL